MEQMFDHAPITTAPVLKTLTIDCHPNDVFSDGSFSLPLAALPGAKLRHLSLSFVQIPWNSHLLSGLIDLRLECIPLSAKPTPEEFLLVLEQNPALRSLTLDDALRTETSLEASPYAGRRILLQSLEVLRVYGEDPCCEFVCRHILLSDKMKKISVRIVYDEDHASSSRHILGILSALQKAYTSPPLGSLSRSAYIGNFIAWHGDYYTPRRSFVLASSGTVNLTPFGFDEDISDFFQSNSGALDIQLSGNTTSPSDMDVTRISEISDFFHGLRWDNLSLLDISWLLIDEPGLDALLATTFGTLPGLRAVAVGPACANPLLNALALNSDKDPVLFPNTVTFPALQYLNFTNVTFAAKDYTSSDLVHMGLLLDCLMDRYERGVAIESIAISWCHLFRKRDWALLQEVVTRVNWDGYSDYDHFTSEDAYFDSHSIHLRLTPGRIPSEPSIFGSIDYDSE